MEKSIDELKKLGDNVTILNHQMEKVQQDNVRGVK